MHPRALQLVSEDRDLAGCEIEPGGVLHHPNADVAYKTVVQWRVEESGCPAENPAVNGPNSTALLPYSCRRRCFCPSCHQKRALLFAEHIDQEVLGDCPVRQYVVTIPKMLRLCFKYDRKLLGLLSQCFYASVKDLFQDAAQDRRALPGMNSSLQSYGDDPTRFHPHLHSLVTEGLVYG